MGGSGGIVVLLRLTPPPPLSSYSFPTVLSTAPLCCKKKTVFVLKFLGILGFFKVPFLICLNILTEDKA